MALLVAVDSIAALTFGPDRLRVPPYLDGSPFMLGDIPVRRIFAIMIIVMLMK